MHDDELMDGLLKDAMASAPPELSKEFDANVMRAVRGPRLTSTGRIVMAAYAVVAIVAMAWLMNGLPFAMIGIAVAACVAVAAGSRAYAQTMARS